MKLSRTNGLEIIEAEQNRDMLFTRMDRSAEMVVMGSFERAMLVLIRNEVERNKFKEIVNKIESIRCCERRGYLFVSLINSNKAKNDLATLKLVVEGIINEMERSKHLATALLFYMSPHY